MHLGIREDNKITTSVRNLESGFWNQETWRLQFSDLHNQPSQPCIGVHQNTDTHKYLKATPSYKNLDRNQVSSLPNLNW